MNTFEPNTIIRNDDISKIEEIRRVYFKYFANKYMTQKDFNKYSRVHSNTLCRRFGTWEKALQLAEIPLTVIARTPRIDLNDIISDLKRVKDINNDKYFSFTLYKQNGGKHDIKMLKRFQCKTWEELLNKEFGLVKEYKKRVIVLKPKKEDIPEVELFNEIKNVWNKFNRRPTYSEFREKSSISTKIYEKRFGTWTKAIEQFCFKNINYNSSHADLAVHTTKELLIQDLLKIKDLHNLDTIGSTEYIKLGGRYSIATFYNHFQGWHNVLEFAGIKPHRNSAPKTELLFDELQRVWEQLGRQPKRKDMEKLCKYPYYFYDNRFHGFTKAIYAFIEDRQSKENDPLINNEGEIFENSPKVVVEKLDVITNTDRNVIVMKTPRIPSTRLRFKVFTRDNFKCKCGRSPATDQTIILHVDHIKPYSKGGETVIENLQTLCSVCNLGKSDLEL